jgi:hypothetical protein
VKMRARGKEHPAMVTFYHFDLGENSPGQIHIPWPQYNRIPSCAGILVHPCFPFSPDHLFTAFIPETAHFLLQIRIQSCPSVFGRCDHVVPALWQGPIHAIIPVRAGKNLHHDVCVKRLPLFPTKLPFNIAPESSDRQDALAGAERFRPYQSLRLLCILFSFLTLTTPTDHMGPGLSLHERTHYHMEATRSSTFVLSHVSGMYVC